MRNTIGQVAAALVLAMAAGCNRPSANPAPAGEPPAGAEPVVRIVKPQRRTVRHPIEQPGFNIEPFQETPLYAKISGYVTKWDPKYDIGRSVREGEVLCELDVPEMVVQLQQKDAAVRQAAAQVQQARAAQLTAEAQLARAKSQHERLSRVGQNVLDRESIDETRLGYQAAQAGVEKAKADVTAAQAELAVAGANRDYAKTMLDYAKIRAPFDGVITQRNVNTRDFVQPAGTGMTGKPRFVVAQLDPVRVFVNVPGADAPWIHDGDPVRMHLQGAGGELIWAKVTRNARALNPQSRTLRTEIDLPNPSGKLLPGTYVQATITVEHANVWTLPSGAVTTEGDQTVCYRLENGKAVRTPLQLGLRGGGLVEVVKKQLKPKAGEEGMWVAVRGDEDVIASEPETLHDGQAVRVKEGKR
jgi:RND family efflux transporter MFP subunit